MSLVRLLLVVLLLGIPGAWFLTGSASAAVQDKPAAKAEDPKERKLRKVRELLASMNTRAISEKSMSSMLESMGAPAEYAQKFKDAFDFDGLIDQTVEIYAKHLEEEEIDALNTFYKGESGKKISAAMMDITIETMKAGQELGKKAAEDIAGGK
jgi:hypothetical protein